MNYGPFDMRGWEILNTSLIVPHMQPVLAESHKFLLTSVLSATFMQFADELIINKLFQLPFDNIYFEYSIEREPKKRYAFWIVGNTDKIYVLPFARNEEAIWTGGVTGALELDIQRSFWNYSELYEDKRFYLYGQQDTIRDVVGATVAMISSPKFKKNEITVPRKLAKARERSKSAPLFSYNIVDLDGFVSERISRGGTHASPALHWRRGHLRQLSNKLIPVAPCLVGSPENGVVVKNYDVRPLSPRGEEDDQARGLRLSHTADAVPAADSPH